VVLVVVVLGPLVPPVGAAALEVVGAGALGADAGELLAAEGELEAVGDDCEVVPVVVVVDDVVAPWPLVAPPGERLALAPPGTVNAAPAEVSVAGPPPPLLPHPASPQASAAAARTAQIPGVLIGMQNLRSRAEPCACRNGGSR
jgi:hypothetical protein